MRRVLRSNRSLWRGGVLGLAGALLVAVPFALANDTSPDVLSVLQRDGEDALAAERFGEACSRFSEVLRLDWNNPRAYDLLQKSRQERVVALHEWEVQGRTAESNHEWDRAQSLYARVLSEDSTRNDLRDRIRQLSKHRSASDLIQVGLDKFISDDFAGAETVFEQVLALNPGDTLAIRYLERTRQRLSGSDPLAAIQADPDSWASYVEALKHLRDGDLAGAEKLWNALLAKYPSNPSIRSNLEQVRRRLGREGAVAADQ